MRPSPHLLTALLLAACAGDPPAAPPDDDPTDCPRWYPDADGDGFGDATAAAVIDCDRPAGHVDNADDCDDARDDVHPEAIEICDDANVDEDCSGAADDDDDDAVGKVHAWPDVDGDGFGDGTATPSAWCDVPEGWSTDDGDCDDTREAVHPNAVEVCDDEDIDEDCSGTADNDDPNATGTVEAWPDLDGDGHGDGTAGSAFYCDVPEGWSTLSDDCDDGNDRVNPSAVEVCDPFDVDEDCSGQADDADPNATGKVETWADADGDGYGDDAVAAIHYCNVPMGRVRTPGDCDDTRANVNPGRTEVCDPEQLDEDCSGQADNDDPNAIGKVDAWPDLDGDGFGNDALPATRWCHVPDFMVTVPGDCDDDVAAAHPGAAPVEDPDACMVDSDGDGWGDPYPDARATGGTDCLPFDPSVHPGAADPEVDGIDQDCDGFDGPTLSDDFELGAFDPATWAQVVGNAAITTTYVGEGTAAADVFGAGGTLETHPFDTSACDLVAWSYLGMQGGAGSPDAPDRLYVEYFDGTDWHVADAWKGSLNNGVWYPRYGVIQWPAAFHGAFQLRLVGGSDSNSDHYYVDDFAVGCAADADGDGAPDHLDCAPLDPLHWSDCGTCLDGDGDHYGDGCDLGGDCNDGGASIHPRAVDATGDGQDLDCSGQDGRGFFDDFEAGALEAWRWGAVDGSVTASNAQAASGAWSLKIDGASDVYTVAHDLGACPSGITWRFMGKRGAPMPEAVDALRFEVLTDSGWHLLDEWFGGAVDATFAERSGGYAGGDVDTTQLRLRFTSSGGGPELGTPQNPGGDTWFVDELRVECAAP